MESVPLVTQLISIPSFFLPNRARHLSQPQRRTSISLVAGVAREPYPRRPLCIAGPALLPPSYLVCTGDLQRPSLMASLGPSPTPHLKFSNFLKCEKINLC